MDLAVPLTRATLQNFNQKRGLSVNNNSADVAHDNNFENNQNEANHVHKDFGKIPKYLKTFKQEAETLEQ
jgi:hypothetical protein